MHRARVIVLPLSQVLFKLNFSHFNHEKLSNCKQNYSNVLNFSLFNNVSGIFNFNLTLGGGNNGFHLPCVSTLVSRYIYGRNLTDKISFHSLGDTQSLE